MDQEKISQNIIQIVCYFDLFDYPLTAIEIHKWLPVKAGLAEVVAALNSSWFNGKIDCRDGLYFLFGRHDLPALRGRRYLLAERKFRRAIFLAKIFSHFPYIRAIAISGSLAYSNARPESDIDLFIVAAKGRAWTTRFFVNSFLSVFNLRPRGDNRRDKICASFFVAADGLDLSFIRHYREDIHFAYWLSQFVFLFGDEAGFFAANSWLADCLPNFYPFSLSARRRLSGRALSWDWLAAWLPENFFRKIQLIILPRRYLALAAAGQDVVLSDQMIKIHTGAKGRQVAERLAQKIESIIKSNG